MLILEYKAEPNKKQIIAIDEAIRTTQFIRNKCIRFWIDSGREAKIDSYALNKYSTALRNEFKFASELNSMACQAAAERAWFSISRFYENCKEGKPGKKGFPKFQKDHRSVEYKTSGWKLHPTKRRITFTDKKGIGELKLLGKWDIHTYDVKQIKRVRIVRRADGYYVQFAVDTEKQANWNETDFFASSEVGIDVGLEYFYSDSNGNHVENPRFLRKAEQEIKASQRKIYKRKKGSSGRKKARRNYAKKHLKVSRQREEFAKRLALTLCKTNVLVAYEDLRISNMVKNHCLAKSITDAAWYQFRKWIEYFAPIYESEAIAVPPHYTSQNCSNCGETVKKSLSTRTHKCLCGCELQRDTNAAINILNLARQARMGHIRSNAGGVTASTLAGETLLEQVVT